MPAAGAGGGGPRRHMRTPARRRARAGAAREERRRPARRRDERPPRSATSAPLECVAERRPAPPTGRRPVSPSGSRRPEQPSPPRRSARVRRRRRGRRRGPRRSGPRTRVQGRDRQTARHADPRAARRNHGTYRSMRMQSVDRPGTGDSWPVRRSRRAGSPRCHDETDGGIGRPQSRRGRRQRAAWLTRRRHRRRRQPAPSQRPSGGRVRARCPTTCRRCRACPGVRRPSRRSPRRWSACAA